MALSISLPKSPLLDGALIVVKAIQEAGHEAYFIGGSVRDMVMGISPKEYDIATSAVPDELICLARQNRWGVIPVGKAFGVIRLRLEQKEYEVATFRTEGDYQAFRHPHLEGVRFHGKLAADVTRRDFTMNGLALNPFSPPFVPIDLVGGLEDIKAGLVRTIGNPFKRFEEDALRPLRAVRFASVLDFQIEKSTWEAVVALGHNIRHVSAERIREEFSKAFQQGKPATAARLLTRMGLLSLLFPTPSPPCSRLFLRLVSPFASLCLPQLVVALCLSQMSGLINEAGIDVRQICSSLKTSSMVRKTSQDTLHCILALALVSGGSPALAQRLRLYRQEVFPPALQFYQTLQEENMLPGDSLAWAFLEKESQTLRQGAMDTKPFLSGKDLLGMGYPAGQHLGAVLDILEDGQLDGRIKTRQDALSIAEELRKKC